ncbi:MAG: hypothetical protein ACAF41_22720 [Leptolyngbya sp. BL-A-14]
MPKPVLQIVGGVFLGCALLAGLAWKDTASRVSSVEQSLSIKAGDTASISFIPRLDGALYIVELKFDGAQQSLMGCSVLQSSGIEWSITRDGKEVNSGNLANLNQTKDLFCNQEGKITTISFSASELALNQKHLLNLYIADKKSRNITLKPTVTVFPFGISVNYALIDLDLQILLTCGLLLIGFGCFLPVVYRLLFRRKLQNQ